MGRAPTLCFMGQDFSYGLRAELRRLLEPGARALGCELVDVELAGGGRHPTLRVYIDKPGGVTVDDCADVSRQLSAILDVEDPIRESYTLEVSSPGLDRPLVTAQDFARQRGETVRIKLQAPLAGRRNFTGRVLEVHDAEVVLEVQGPGGARECVCLRLDGIERARLVPKF